MNIKLKNVYKHLMILFFINTLCPTQVLASLPRNLDRTRVRKDEVTALIEQLLHWFKQACEIDARKMWSDQC